jgi:hypothetical protein
VGVEKVTVISKRSGGRSVVKGRNPFHALLDHYSWRRANDDGQHCRSEALFYYFRLEDQVPKNHPVVPIISPRRTPRRFEIEASLRRFYFLKAEPLVELFVRLAVDLDIRVDEVI